MSDIGDRSSSRLIVRGQRVVLPEGERAASIHIDRGVIVRVGAYDEVSDGAEIVDAGSSTVIPGLVDTHVHVNEPGRTEWEGFDTATRAAAAGGVTTLVDMPLNSIPATTTVAALAAKRRAARTRCHVDVAFWGGIVPGNEDEIVPLSEDGVRGFKCFLTPSGVDEFQPVTENDLRLALPQLAKCSPRRPLLVHAEDPSKLEPTIGDRRAYVTFLATRPAEAEVSAVQSIAALACEYDVAAHIVHVSSAEGIATIAAAQGTGIRLTGETCPHYLTFSSGEIADGATLYKCTPPIRSARHRDELWRALDRRVLTMIASDHSPAPATRKKLESGDFIGAWGGIASLELSLRAVWTGASGRGFSLARVVEWMAEQTAGLCGLMDRKGAIRVGSDADLVLFDPDTEERVTATGLQQRQKLTPYAGRMLRGVVRTTFLRGVKVWDGSRILSGGQGVLL